MSLSLSGSDEAQQAPHTVVVVAVIARAALEQDELEQDGGREDGSSLHLVRGGRERDGELVSCTAVVGGGSGCG